MLEDVWTTATGVDGAMTATAQVLPNEVLPSSGILPNAGKQVASCGDLAVWDATMAAFSRRASSVRLILILSCRGGRLRTAAAMWRASSASQTARSSSRDLRTNAGLHADLPAAPEYSRAQRFSTEHLKNEENRTKHTYHRRLWPPVVALMGKRRKGKKRSTVPVAHRSRQPASQAPQHEPN